MESKSGEIDLSSETEQKTAFENEKRTALLESEKKKQQARKLQKDQRDAIFEEFDEDEEDSVNNENIQANGGEIVTAVDRTKIQQSENSTEKNVKGFSNGTATDVTSLADLDLDEIKEDANIDDYFDLLEMMQEEIIVCCKRILDVLANFNLSIYRQWILMKLARQS